jgi:hypothetical protein
VSKEQLKARKDPTPGINRSGSDGCRERLDDAARLARKKKEWMTDVERKGIQQDKRIQPSV